MDALIVWKEDDTNKVNMEDSVKLNNSIILLHTKRKEDDTETMNAPVRRAARKSTRKLPENHLKIIKGEICCGGESGKDQQLGGINLLEENLEDRGLLGLT